MEPFDIDEVLKKPILDICGWHKDPTSGVEKILYRHESLKGVVIYYILLKTSNSTPEITFIAAGEALKFKSNIPF